MSFNTAASWIKFFDAAGLPTAAASYAHIFVENRIQMDMLMDLNKEYLREMGICPMGDIIAILRHAKSVHDQYTREKVIKASAGASIKPTAKVASEVRRSSSSTSTSSSSNVVKINPTRPVEVPVKKPEAVVAVAPKPRRVLPEHEGRYKITLPSGTTQRSKDILAKKMAMDQKKTGIFDRLSGDTRHQQHSEDMEDMEMDAEDDHMGPQTVRITGLEKVNSSVFARLGGRSGESSSSMSMSMPSSSFDQNRLVKPESYKSTSGILKSPSPVKKHLVGAEIVSIKKVPAKAATMVADEYERAPSIGQRLVFKSNSMMDHDQGSGKSVKFSAEDEVVEIDSRRVMIKPKLKNNIRQRLGAKHPQPANGKASVLASLHSTRKTIKLKGSSSASNRMATNKVKLLKYGALRSEDLLQQTVPSQSVHSRLDFHKKAELLANRIGRVSLDGQKSGGGGSGGGGLVTKKKSVFNRLGFGK